MRTDDEHKRLVARIASGDVAAWADLWADLGPGVMRYVASLLRRPADDPDVQELASEVFDKLLSSAPTFRRESKVGTWVLGIAKYTVREHLRSRRLEQLPDEAEPAHPAESDTPIPIEQLEPLLSKLLDTLPPAQRAAVERRWYVERLADDAQPAMDAAARQNLSRGRKRLLETIETDADFAVLRPWLRN